MRQEVYFENIRDQIIKDIKQSKSSIHLAVAWITDPILIDELINCLKRGVTIKILSYNNHINKFETFKELYYRGAEIRLSEKLMHNKFCIIDTYISITGSYNWTVKANFNDENITICDNKELANKFMSEFTSLWIKCKNIDNKLTLNWSKIESLEIEFQQYLLKLPNTPFFFKLENDYPPINNIRKRIFNGYYLIKNYEEINTTIRYLFYLEKDIDIEEIEKVLDRQLKINSIHFAHIYPEQKYFLTEIKKDFLGIKSTKQEFLKKNYIYKINRGLKLDKVGELLFLIDKNAIFLDITNNYIRLIDKLGIERLKINTPEYTYNHFDVVKFNEFFFSVKIKIHEDYSKYALFNYKGKQISKPFFTFIGNATNYKTNENFTFKEYPLAYINSNDLFIRFTNEKTDQFVYKEWILENDALRQSSINHFNTHYQDGKMIYNESTQLFFYSDEKYGEFYLGIKLLKINLKIKDYKTLLEQFQKKCCSTNNIGINLTDDQKLNIAITLIKPYIELYNKEKLEEKRKLDLENKMDALQNTNQGYCYVATMVYGDYNHSEVLFLRDFRDTVLSKSDYGQKFIKWYYKNSPQFVSYVKDKPILNSFTSGIIYTLVLLLKILKKK